MEVNVLARITTINFKNKEDADKSIEDYSEKAPSEFPEAEQLLQIRVSDTTILAVLYMPIMMQWNVHQLLGQKE